MTAAVRVRRVTTPAALSRFIDIAYRIRGHETHWVPPLRRDMVVLTDRNKHPFHEHAQVDYFLAYDAITRECLGRIAAIENFAHNTFHGERIGFFGFLDAVPRADVFAALLRAAERWAVARGLTALRGPCSFSTNEECGLLVEGFDALPAIMTPWTPESWPAFIEAAGYRKSMDLWSWWISEDIYNQRFEKLSDRVLDKAEKRGEPITVRAMRMSDYANELEHVRRIYNSAWETNWGFVPMTPGEIDFMAKEMKPVINPDIFTFLEVGGTPVAFAFSLPDYNQILRHLRGKLGPKQLALFALLKGELKQMRMLAMGVEAPYRQRGFESVLVHKNILACRAVGIHQAECGWTLEHNDSINRLMAAIGARHYRTHRIYEKALAPK